MPVMFANVTLYVAALRLYGALLDHDPPDGCDEQWWDHLIAASEHLYLLAARRPSSRDEVTARLHDLAGATRECLDLLESASLAVPLVRRAWLCLHVVVEEIEAELQTTPCAAAS